MPDSRAKKYYWLKLDRNFFKRHDIKIVESMPNGKDYVLFYLKLLLESIDHEGKLRFNETIPYDDKMLSVVTDTNIDVVRSAVKVFEQLGLMNLYDDSTIFMTETQKLIGSETGWAILKRDKRDNDGKLSHKLPIDIDIDIELDKDKEKDKEVSNNNSDLYFMDQLNKDVKKNTTFETLEKLIKNNFLTPKRDLTEVEARQLFDWVSEYPRNYLEHIISDLCLISTDKRNFRYLKAVIIKAYDTWSDKPIINTANENMVSADLNDVFAELKALKEKGKK
jgi:predicted phage replisome organizer